MRRSIYIILALSPLLCYMKWGGGNAAFVGEVAAKLFFHREANMSSYSHPLILLPILGLLLLLTASLGLRHSQRFAIIGQLLLSPLVAIILLSGLLSSSFSVIGSCIPFIVASVIFYWQRQRH